MNSGQVNPYRIVSNQSQQKGNRFSDDMRIIIEQNNITAELYWIDLQKTRNNVIIVGWCGGDFLKHLNETEPNLKFEYNFTYPANGNFYNTFRIWSEDNEQIVNVYSDRISVQGTFLKDNSNWNVLTTDLLCLLAKTVPDHKHLPLREVRSFSFPTISIPVKNGAIDFPETQSKKSTPAIKGKNDLIIHPIKFDTGIIKISAQILRKDAELPMDGLNPCQALTCEIYDNLILNLYSSFIQD